MPDYRRWTLGIYQFFTAGAAYGEAIYLRLSPENLALIGSELQPQAPAEGWTKNFCRAVRKGCLDGARLVLELSNYYIRLREALGLSCSHRPSGGEAK